MDHPLRTAPNTVLMPHLGYGVREIWAQFYPESVENALAFLDGKPVRVMNPEVLHTWASTPSAASEAAEGASFSATWAKLGNAAAASCVQFRR